MLQAPKEAKSAKIPKSDDTTPGEGAKEKAKHPPKKVMSPKKAAAQGVYTLS
jgi:hypothetical protein